MPAANATASVANAGSAAATEASVRFISDDELLKLFPGRPVALIGGPGRQQFVFLDQKRQASTAGLFSFLPRADGPISFRCPLSRVGGGYQMTWHHE